MKTSLTLNGVLSVFALTFVLASCGGAQEREDEPAGKGDGENLGTADLLEDSDVVGQAISAQVDDALAGASEDQDPEAGATLVGVTKEGEASNFRACTDDGTTALVEIKRSVTRTISFDGPKRAAETSFAAYFEKHREWSKEEGEINCGPNKKFAELPILDMAGVSLAVTFKHERSRTSSMTNKKKGETVSRSFHHTVEGTRAVKWTAVVTEGEVVIVTKEVSGAATRKLEITNKKGEAKTLEGSLESLTGAPLIVEVRRDATTLVAASRTLKSGTLVATGKNGGRVETSFKDVFYEVGKGCFASSGSISGKIFDKDATEPTLTFEVTFDGDSKTITFSNGEEYDYAPEGCELDEPTTAVEATAATEVTNPVGAE